MQTKTLKVVQKVNDQGQLLREAYWQNDTLHNEHGPTLREWNAQGQLISESYYQDNKLHNEHGPAYCRWNSKGQLMSESYWQGDKLHNEHGPAIREWNDQGQLVYESYWQNGKQIRCKKNDVIKDEKYLISDSMGCRLGIIFYLNEKQEWVFYPDDGVDYLQHFELDSITARLKSLNEKLKQ